MSDLGDGVVCARVLTRFWRDEKPWHCLLDLRGRGIVVGVSAEQKREDDDGSLCDGMERVYRTIDVAS